MRKSFRWLSLFVVPALVVSLSALMVACGGDDEGDGGGEPAAFVSSSPADGADVAEGAPVTLTFDSDPGDVTVNGAAATGAGATRTFNATAAANTVTWADGSVTLNFNLLPPDEVAPSLTGSSISDGDNNVDPAGPNADGIELTFDEDIASQEITLSSGGSSLQWIPTVDGSTVTLLPNSNNPLVNEKDYEVSGSVEDASGNSTDVSISFTTEAKE